MQLTADLFNANLTHVTNDQGEAAGTVEKSGDLYRARLPDGGGKHFSNFTAAANYLNRGGKCKNEPGQKIKIQISLF